MKDSGLLTFETVREWRGTAMETCTKEISKEARPTVRAFTIGLMEKCTMESGRTELKKAMECGKEYLEIHTLVNGKTAKLMVTEFINGKMAIGMKAAGSIA